VNIIEGLDFRNGIPISIEIVGANIHRIRHQDELTESSLSQLYIAPGFIDNQVNGYLGVDFSARDLTVEDIRKVTRGLWKTGVTTYLPTVITGSRDRLLKNFEILAEALHDPEVALSVPGFHLEGPYISPEDGYRGAHNKDFVRRPDWQEFARLNRAANHKIIQITLAPEGEGALDFILHCVRQGIVVGLGHHNASPETIRQAVDNGASIATHLGNGCANLIHRHKNPLWCQLAEDRLMASVIVDGFHLDSCEVRTFFRAKGADRLVIISDLTSLAGMPPGKYSWNGMPVVLTPAGMIEYPEQRVLAGASLPIHRGIFNMMKFTNCSLVEAIQMVTRNVARLNQLSDRGEIYVGKRADLVLFRLHENGLAIEKTFVAGKEVYRATERC